jgi:hypothetical protein
MAQRSRGGGLLLAGALAVGLLVGAPWRTSAAVMYVDAAISGGTGDGSSWDNAFAALADALVAAPTGTDLWVAQGTYTNTDSVYLRGFVNLYGGFTNGMASAAARDWNAHPALLDGQGIFTVLIGTNNMALDGFVITNGAGGNGGGLYVTAYAPTLRNCTFANNYAGYGAALFVQRAGTAVSISNCVFRDNLADAEGGAIRWTSPIVDVRDCVFVRNKASRGGAMNTKVSMTGLVENCRFIGNGLAEGDSGNGSGGALNMTGAAGVVFRGCVFTHNLCPVTTSGGGAVNTSGDGSNVVYEACTFSGNRSMGYGAAVYASGASKARFERCVFAGNDAGRTGGALHNVDNAALRIENAFLAGNQSSQSGGGLFFVNVNGAGAAGILHSTFVGNRATQSGGAMAGGAGPLPITNSIVWGNSATTGAEIHQQTAGAVSVGYSFVRGGWAGTGTNVFTADPQFVATTGGTWSATGDYDPTRGQTALTDAGASWLVNAHRGKTVNPNTNQWLQLAIASNGVNTLYVWGDARTNRLAEAVADVGAAYAISEYAIVSTSPAVDAALNVGVLADLPGKTRPHGPAMDIGAFEYPDSLAPAAISGLTASGGVDQVLLRWTNPTTADFDAVLIVRREGSAPTGIPVNTNHYVRGDTVGNGTVAYFGPGTDNTPSATNSAVDIPVGSGKTWHYRVFAADYVPNFAVGVNTSASTLADTAAPQPVTGLAAISSLGAITLAWTNPATIDFAGVLILRRVGGTPPAATVTNGMVYTLGMTVGDSTVAYVGTASDGTTNAPATWTDLALPDGAHRSYAVLAYDDVPNYAAAATAGAITPLPGVRFVDVDATAGTHSGLNWTDAYTNLYDALRNTSGLTAIWVAEGLYTPGNERTNLLAIPAGLALYGGFAGTEASTAERVREAHPTILSGEIGDPGVTSDNSERIVRGYAGSVLDGFRVERGYGSGGGAGLFVFQTGPFTVRDCTFVSNEVTAADGGAVYFDSRNQVELLTIERCRFAENRASGVTGCGGGVDIEGPGQYSKVVNCLFMDNTAVQWGGDLANKYGTADSPVLVVNCTFANAFKDCVAAGLGSPAGALRLVNCILWRYDGGYVGRTMNGADISIQNCIIDPDGWSIGEGSPGTITDLGGNFSGNPLFDNSLGGDFHLAVGSPGVDTGTASEAPANDLDAHARPYGTAYDIGAYEQGVLVVTPLEGLILMVR